MAERKTRAVSDVVDLEAGERLELAAYYVDFEVKLWSTSAPGFWKLERQQFFKEPGNPSWEAFAAGDWGESMRLIEAGRPDMIDYYRRIEEHGFVNRRVRVVEQPLTPYLQWELHVLRMRDQYGGKVRIVTEEQIADAERAAPLPEIYTHGTSTMYQAIYDDDASWNPCAGSPTPLSWRAVSGLSKICTTSAGPWLRSSPNTSPFFPRRVTRSRCLTCWL